MQRNDFNLRHSGFINLPDSTKRVLISVEKSDTAAVTAQSVYEFVCQELQTKQSVFVVHLNRQIGTAIDALVAEGAWTNLRRIAQHAAESAVKCLKNSQSMDARLELEPCKLTSEILVHAELKLAALDAGGADAYRAIGQRMLALADELDARYQANDGSIHDTEEEAQRHELRLSMNVGIRELVEEKLNDSEDPQDSDYGFLSIDDVVDFIIANASSISELLENHNV